MPARHFTAASTELIRTSLGGLGFAFGPGSMAAIVRVASRTVNRCVLCAGNGNAASYRLVVQTNGILNLATNNSGVAGVTALTNAKWYFIGVSKATGSVAPRFHIYDYATNTWVHENSASTLANSSSPVTKANIGIEAAETAFPFDGDIAAAGVWNIVLSDAQFELLAYDVANWFSAAQPKGFWLLDQDAVAQKVIDQAGGGANQSSITGTSLGTNSVPIFTRGEPILLERARATATTFFGSSTVALTFGATTAGQAIFRTASTAAFTFGATTAGQLTAKSSSTAPFVCTISTAGQPTKFSTSTAALTFNATTAGVRTRLGASTAAFVFTATSAGIRAASGSSTAAFTFSATTAGTRTLRTSSTAAFVFAASTAGTRTLRTTSTAAFTFNATSSGLRGAFGTSTAPLLFGATAAGRPTKFATATAPFLFTATSLGGLAHFGTSTVPLVFHVTSAGHGQVVFPAGIRGHIAEAGEGDLTEPGPGIITEPSEGTIA